MEGLGERPSPRLSSWFSKGKERLVYLMGSHLCLP